MSKPYLNYLSFALVAAIVVKGLMKGFSFTDAPICLILGALVVWHEIKVNFQKLETLEKDLAACKTFIASMAKDLEIAKSAVSSLKLSTGLKPPIFK
jgi:hypothetical protein